MPVSVADSLDQLILGVSRNTSVIIKPIDGFKPDTAVRTELRKKIKDTQVKGVIMTTEMFDTLSDTTFEPPLNIGARYAIRDSNEIVYPINNHVGKDPRTSGRIIKIGPKDVINPNVLKYMVYNAGQYGFIHYGPKDPSVWYWRGDLAPYTYTADQVVNTFTGELKYLL